MIENPTAKVKSSGNKNQIKIFLRQFRWVESGSFGCIGKWTKLKTSEKKETAVAKEEKNRCPSVAGTAKAPRLAPIKAKMWRTGPNSLDGTFFFRGAAKGWRKKKAPNCFFFRGVWKKNGGGICRIFYTWQRISWGTCRVSAPAVGPFHNRRHSCSRRVATKEPRVAGAEFGGQLESPFWREREREREKRTKKTVANALKFGEKPSTKSIPKEGSLRFCSELAIPNKKSKRNPVNRELKNRHPALNNWVKSNW